MKPRYQRRLPANYQLPTTSYELENWEATWPFPGGTWPLGRYQRLIAKRIPRESVQRFPGFRRFVARIQRVRWFREVMRPSDKSVLRSIASDIPVVMSRCDRESRRMMRNARRRTCN